MQAHSKEKQAKLFPSLYDFFEIFLPFDLNPCYWSSFHGFFHFPPVLELKDKDILSCMTAKVSVFEFHESIQVIWICHFNRKVLKSKSTFNKESQPQQQRIKVVEILCVQLYKISVTSQKSQIRTILSLVKSVVGICSSFQADGQKQPVGSYLSRYPSKFASSENKDLFVCPSA